MPVGDRTDPDIVRDFLGLSKKNFKDALGHLYRRTIVPYKTVKVHIRQSRPDYKTVKAYIRQSKCTYKTVKMHI